MGVRGGVHYAYCACCAYCTHCASPTAVSSRSVALSRRGSGKEHRSLSSALAGCVHLESAALPASHSQKAACTEVR